MPKITRTLALTGGSALVVAALGSGVAMASTHSSHVQKASTVSTSTATAGENAEAPDNGVEDQGTDAGTETTATNGVDTPEAGDTADSAVDTPEAGDTPDTPAAGTQAVTPTSTGTVGYTTTSVQTGSTGAAADNETADNETADNGSEQPGAEADGPGGHQDGPGNVDHQFQGNE